MIDISPVLDFLPSRTPAGWVDRAMADLPTLLLDHASLELKAAQQAQRLMRKYGARPPRRSNSDDREGTAGNARATRRLGRYDLLNKMSRLAREELRHFEQVLAILEERDIAYRPISASRYASGLHEEIRQTEPGRFLDSLLVGAIIEARSCERFYTLLPRLETEDPELGRFYASLLRSEARHFSDYLELARKAAGGSIDGRVARLLTREAVLMSTPDPQIRFHSGVAA